MTHQGVVPANKQTRVRYLMVAMLFILTAVNYADRSTLSIVGPTASKALGIDTLTLGYIFSSFGWAYVMAQLPGGWLLDRFGSKRVYTVSLTLWSAFTALQAAAGFFTGAAAALALGICVFLVGLSEGPTFPGNARIVAAWFPTHERGTASAIFNSAQYFATVLFAPLMAWITHAYGWQTVFLVMGGIGLVLAIVWMKLLYSPKDHPMINAAEYDYIKNGGGLVDLDAAAKKDSASGPKLAYVKQLFQSRMMVGVYLGQYFITTLTYFFITWFPIYLMQQRHMSILKAGIYSSFPAVAGFVGGILGGVISDALLRKGYSLTVARKIPIVAGMLIATSMVACNYIDSEALVIAIMTLSFFGKGIGALGWAVVSDTSPKEIGGLNGGVFNMIGNSAAITAPIVIGYLVAMTGSFASALVYVALNAICAIGSYLFIVGDIKRLELKPV